ncbi:MAG: hypothetical protein ACKVQK_12180 [Burkholderiales bacterium]
MVRQGTPQTLAPVFGAAQEVQIFLRRSGYSFCFIGGVALQRWGQPRFTLDVDLTLLAPFVEELKPLLGLRETPENLSKLREPRSKADQDSRPP